MDCNERYKTIDSKLQGRIKTNSLDICEFGKEDEDVVLTPKEIIKVLEENNNVLKKSFGEIVRLRRTIKNISKQYEEAIQDLTKVEKSLVEELIKLQQENDELRFRLDGLGK